MINIRVGQEFFNETFFSVNPSSRKLKLPAGNMSGLTNFFLNKSFKNVIVLHLFGTKLLIFQLETTFGFKMYTLYF